MNEYRSSYLRYSEFLRNQGNELMNEHFGLVSINDKPSIDRDRLLIFVIVIRPCSSSSRPVGSIHSALTLQCLFECLSFRNCGMCLRVCGSSHICRCSSHLCIEYLLKFVCVCGLHLKHAFNHFVVVSLLIALRKKRIRQ